MMLSDFHKIQTKEGLIIEFSIWQRVHSIIYSIRLFGFFGIFSLFGLLMRLDKPERPDEREC